VPLKVGAPANQCVLVENASVAAAVVAARWAWRVRPGDAVLVLDWRCEQNFRVLQGVGER
jgi:hypothetical protein